jgi:hypothetical protein
LSNHGFTSKTPHAYYPWKWQLWYLPKRWTAFNIPRGVFI